jgi:DNA replication factor GINS
MYSKLYKAWEVEAEIASLQPLTKEFYPKMQEYLKGLEAELRLLDVKSLKFRLKEQEFKQARRMAKMFIEIRLRKMVDFSKIKEGTVDPKNLTDEEKILHEQIGSSSKILESFVDELLEVGMSKSLPKSKPHRPSVVRFIKETPAIIGADMKTYGPFKVGDVASLPDENIEGLIKHHLAKKVEIQ